MATGGITAEVVGNVAWLSRLHLEGQELAQIAGQLDEILTYVRQLQAVPTDGVEPTSHVVTLGNVLREDESSPSLSQEAVLALAPSRRPPFITVPKVIADH
jgi:aspartyl-tRNA(Asn)/glutamyl-tRNA(Gln) amidotransferase subunit C